MDLCSVKLRQLRLINKLSQEELAFQLGISQSTISEWERANSNVKLEYMLLLCKIFKVNIEVLSFGEASNICLNHSYEEKKENIPVNTEMALQNQIIQLQNQLIEQLRIEIQLLKDKMVQ